MIFFCQLAGFIIMTQDKEIPPLNPFATNTAACLYLKLLIIFFRYAIYKIEAKKSCGSSHRKKAFRMLLPYMWIILVHPLYYSSPAYIINWTETVFYEDTGCPAAPCTTFSIAVYDDTFTLGDLIHSVLYLS